MKKTICDFCEECEVKPIETDDVSGEYQIRVTVRKIGPEAGNLDICWKCFDELRMNDVNA